MDDDDLDDDDDRKINLIATNAIIIAIESKTNRRITLTNVKSKYECERLDVK